MLRQNRDLVILVPPAGRLRPLDVAFYKRNDNYYLHRVIAVKDGHYLIRGDNTYTLEVVPDSAVIGVLQSFVRKGKQYDAGSRTYRCYARFRTATYPLRYFRVRLGRLAAKALHGGKEGDAS